MGKGVLSACARRQSRPVACRVRACRPSLSSLIPLAAFRLPALLVWPCLLRLTVFVLRFSLLSVLRRSFVVLYLGCVFVFAFLWRCLVFAFSSSRSLVFAALRAGGLVGVVARASRRSPSGVVVVPVFASLAAASRFASLVAARAAGRFPAVRPVRGRGGAVRFGVSVPVAGAAPGAPVLLAARGVRGVAAAAAALAAVGV